MKIKKTVMVALVLISPFMPAKVYEDTGLKSPGFLFVNKVELVVNGVRAEGRVFFSGNSPEELTVFYGGVFRREGFKEIKTVLNEGEARCLVFVKEKLRSTVQLFEANKGTAVVRYESEAAAENAGEKSKDNPGRDPEDVPRPPLSTRELTVERESGPEISLIVSYKLSGSTNEITKYYAGKMEKTGWRNITEESKVKELLVFEGKNKWCAISINGGYLTIACYYVKRRNGEE